MAISITNAAQYFVALALLSTFSMVAASCEDSSIAANRNQIEANKELIQKNDAEIRELHAHYLANAERSPSTSGTAGDRSLAHSQAVSCRNEARMVPIYFAEKNKGRSEQAMLAGVVNVGQQFHHTPDIIAREEAEVAFIFKHPEIDRDRLSRFAFISCMHPLIPKTREEKAK
jgi:hypothetical protein